ncbi:MAG: flagellar hook-associated protein FlgK [Lachnospiraceae bacterium]|jgi:flagellar hook-associated protein 1 FlgK|nr:flagellar hook-associated protein FlgK [Lachnospiraceae bacterium]
MGSTFFGLNIGRTGLYAFQAALDTTAHNIANAEADGYSRQILGMRADRALRVNSTYGMAGTGVSVTGVTQMRDEYYDIKFRNNNTIFGEYSNKMHYMTEIENYFNEISVEGFTTSYNSMNDNLHELTKNPSSSAVRTQVVNYATTLTEYFHSVSQNLSATQESCNFEVGNMVDKINSFAQQIASLTKQIDSLEVRGGTANDLRDERNRLLDELSEIANTTVTERRAENMSDITSFVVKIDGQTLVDGMNYNTLKAVPREQKVNQNDVDGLYDIFWQNGQSFNTNSATLRGTLKALFEVRDGNNAENLKGTVASAENTEVTMSDGTSKKVTHVKITGTNINAVEKLNIPDQGTLTIHNKTYNYTGFKIEKDGSGDFVYTFELEEVMDPAALEGKSISLGKSISYKGIPYYMSKMNELVRTYAKAFNQIHRTGKDLDNESGMDFFTAVDKVSGKDYAFGTSGSNEDFDEITSRTGSFYQVPAEGKPFYGSYYLLTAENFAVNSSIIKDPDKLVAASDVTNGVENNDIAEELLALKDKRIFIQGTTEGFFQSLIAEIGTDTDKSVRFSKAQENIKKSIENQRLSICGVDIDEEAMSLIRYQNAYSLSAKVISVMDEIYNKLINEMGA